MTSQNLCEQPDEPVRAQILVADAHRGKYVDANRAVLISWGISVQEDFLTNEIVC